MGAVVFGSMSAETSAAMAKGSRKEPAHNDEAGAGKAPRRLHRLWRSDPPEVQWNWDFSVEPFKASVDAVPPLMTWATSSK